MKLLRVIAGLLLILHLTACSVSNLSRSTLEKAITLQLQYTQQELSQQLGLAEPDFRVQRIQVSQQMPLRIDRLPGYRVEGNYDITLQFPHHKIVQRDNPFVVYLQQQVKGQTWRLFIPEAGDRDDEQIWTSYLVE